MRTQFSSFRLFFIVALSIFLYACSTMPISQFDREQYLQSFIGQTSQSIYSNLDLTQIGYEQSQEPVLIAHQLTYIIQRSVMIPLSVAQSPVTGTGSIPIPNTATASQRYDVELQCRIVFQLKDNIATSVAYTGRTC